MGVQGLWKLVEPCGRLVPLEAMSNKVLAVDVSIWLHQAMQGMHDVQGAPVAIAPLLVLFHRLCKLLFYKIKPVFVFDGGVPALKRQTMANRRVKKSSARSEVSKVRGKLLKNLLKHEALRQVLTDQTATAVLGLNSLALPGPAEDEELYKLPAVAAASHYSESSGAEESGEDEEDLGGEVVDIHSLDVTSPAFLALSAEARHDILSDIKDTRKQNSWRNIDQMPQQSQDFSQFQMQRLLKRRQVQVCLEECGKEMGARDVSMQELQGMLGGFTAGAVTTGRVAQEDNTKYMLVQKPKNLPIVPDSSKPGPSNTLIGTSEGFDITNHLEDVQWSSDSDGEIEKRLKSPAKSNPRDGHLRPHELPLSQMLGNDSLREIAAVLAEGLEPAEKIDWREDVLEETEPRADKGSQEILKETMTMEVNEETKPELVNLSDDFEAHSGSDIPMVVDEEKELKEEDKLETSNSNRREALEPVKIENEGSSLEKPTSEINVLDDSGESEEELTVQEKTEKLDTPCGSSEVKTLLTPDDSSDVHMKITSETEKAKQLLEARKKILEDLRNQLKKPKPLTDSIMMLSQESNDELINRPTESTKNGQPELITSADLVVVDPPKLPDQQKPIELPQKTAEILSEPGDIHTDDSGLTFSVDQMSSQVTSSLAVEDSAHAVNSEDVDVTMEEPVKSPDADDASDTDSDFIEVNDSPPTYPGRDSSKEDSDTGDVESSPQKAAEASSSEEPVMEKMTEEEMRKLQKELESERDGLMGEKGRQERLAQNVSDQMYQDAQELLQLFGVPYVVAPMEAEAQCAALDLLGLTNGTITDDSDIWLFGGTTVYKNFFNQKKHVLEFRADDLKQYFKLDREELVRLALLVGSDYTTGLAGVGPVTALEVLAAFPSRAPSAPPPPSASHVDHVLLGLRRFQQWLASGFTVGPSKLGLKNKLKNTHLTPSFPSSAVVEAYLRPEVDDSREPFSWSRPSLQLLEKYTNIKFGWTPEKCRELLLPVMKKLLETTEQPTLERYFRTVQPAGLLEGKLSKRVEGAVKRLGAPTSDLDDEQPGSSRVKKPRVRATKSAAGDGATKPQEIAPSGSLDPLTQRLHAETIIPQRQQDCLDRLQKKQKAAEILRRGRARGRGRGHQLRAAPHQAKVNLSESDSD